MEITKETMQNKLNGIIDRKGRDIMEYIYLGDRLTRPDLKKAKCKAIRRENGKCIRSRIATMLVVFENGERHVVLARLLRKLKCK